MFYCWDKDTLNKALAEGGQLIGKKKISGHDCHIVFFKNGCPENYKKTDCDDIVFSQLLTF